MVFFRELSSFQFKKNFKYVLQNYINVALTCIGAYRNFIAALANQCGGNTACSWKRFPSFPQGTEKGKCRNAKMQKYKNIK